MAKDEIVINYIKEHPHASSKEVFEGLNGITSYATVKRNISALLDKQYILQQGNGKNSRYSLSPAYNLFFPIDMESYYSKEVDERIILNGYNFSLISDVLTKVSLFTKEELELLHSLQAQYTANSLQLTPNEYQKEMERLGVDLSWKSSQIEGNTYSLLETERLLKERETAAGKTKEEAVMLLNHKDALDFLVQNPDYLSVLSVARIEDLHSILVKELDIDRNIRTRRVGITGTNYRPIDNEFQIREALVQTCDLVNSRENVFEKALLILVLLSYIQAFNDGNKRVARISCNAILIANKYCPISFRSVDSMEYKKAMILFYEQNNLSAFKQIFISQFRFAVETYF